MVQPRGRRLTALSTQILRDNDEDLNSHHKTLQGQLKPRTEEC